MPRLSSSSRGPLLKTLIFSFIIILAHAGLVHAQESLAAENPSSSEWQALSSSAGNRPGGVTNFLREGPSGGVWQRSQLFGSIFGLRSWLGKYGVSLNLNETSEYLGNTSGGTQKSFVYDGLTTMDLQVDTKRAFGFYGGLFNASALQVHGKNLTTQNLETLQTASGIEADTGFRLWELWYQQIFAFNQFDIKIGNQSLDQEFMVSQYAGLFVNTMFGWPMLTSADLLSGGPAYPLASLGARIHGQASGSPWAFLGGVFDDNPGGVDPQVLPVQDSQAMNINGTNFRTSDKPLLILEVQYSRPAIGEMEYANQSPILPATYKLGFWYDFGQFPDQEFGTDGLSLADPASNKTPALVRGNYSFYGVIDQLVWRKTPESPEGIGVFLRAMGGPSRQNLITYSMNLGVSWHAPLRHREYDVFGLAMGETNVGSRARALDQDMNRLVGDSPVRTSETFIEFTYQYQVVPWWTLQPDAQFVIHPGADQQYGNEFVFGLRTNMTL